MRFLIAVIVMLSCSPAYADSWAQQQQRYNEKMRAEQELFQQQEELDRLKRENEKQMEELSRQREQQESEIRKLKEQQKDFEQQRRSDDFSRQIEQWQLQNELKDMKDDQEQRQKYLELKSANEKAAAESTIEVDNQSFAPMFNKMSKEGFTSDQINTVIEAYKGFIYRAIKSAEAGDATAQENLGDAFYSGVGVKQDHAESAKWYARAAEQENASAQYKLSLMYAFGHGVPVDYTQSAVLMKRAGENGHAEAKAKYESLLSEAKAKYGLE